MIDMNKVKEAWSTHQDLNRQCLAAEICNAPEQFKLNEQCLVAEAFMLALSGMVTSAQWAIEMQHTTKFGFDSDAAWGVHVHAQFVASSWVAQQEQENTLGRVMGYTEPTVC